ncbi:MAG: AmmeMemoRadiSam system protein A [Acidobacteriota bacterium]|nr:AmmeMemoRadiSam system protein A [Acidobacteriota bacterium]
MAELSQADKKYLLALARETIRKHLAPGERGAGVAPPSGSSSVLLDKRGVFVTLHRGGELRGCIGYPLPLKPLWEAVQEMALAAAFDDPRFPAVAADELAGLDIEISVLTVPQKVAGPDRVRVGVDGIIVSKGLQRGLLLPQVPAEQGWDLEQYISYGCRKAGLPADEWRRGVQIETFQAVVFGEKRQPEDA